MASEKNFSDSLDEVKDAAMLSDGNQAQWPMAVSSKVLPGEEGVTVDKFFTRSDSPASKPIETLAPMPEKNLMRSIDQSVIIIPRQFRDRNTEKPKAAPIDAMINKPCTKNDCRGRRQRAD